MAKVEVKLNSHGVREVLRSDAVAEMCMSRAALALSRCGSGYEIDTRTYPERKGAVIKATSYKARKDNAENNTLLKAVQ